MESIPKGNLSFFDDEEEGKPNEQEAKTHMTLSVVEGEADSSAIAESSHIVMPTMYTRTEHSSSTSPNGGQQFMHNSLPQRESHGLPSSQKVPDSLDISEYMHPRRRRAPYFLKESIPVAKAKMLKFKGFDQFVEITPDEQEGWINIMARSEDEFINIQIHMHACLEQVITVKKEEVMDKTLVEFLDTSPCRKCLNDELTEKQIEAVLDVDTKLCKLVVHAYTDVNLDKAFNVVDKILILRDIPLQPHEVDAIAMAVDRVSQMNSQLVRIIMSPKSVKLYSLDSKVVDEIERQISNTKREFKPKEVVYEIETQISNTKRELKPKDVSFTASVELCNAKARCFKEHFSSDLESAIRQRNGQYMSVQTDEDDNIKVTVTVTGELGLKDLLEQTVRKIYQERFEFSKASIDANDEHLLRAGLTDYEGRTFFKLCEASFNCFIDVSNKREDPSHGTSRVKVVSTEDSNPSNSSDDDVSSSEEDDTLLHEAEPKRSTRQTLSALQGDIRDDDIALLLAIQISQEECSGGQQQDGSDSDGDSSGMDARTCSHMLNNIHVHIVQGNIVKQQADALVNIVSPNMKFGESRVSKNFSHSFGPDLEMAYDEARRNNPHSRVLVTQGVRDLRRKNVIHVGLRRGKENCKKCVGDTMTQILQECENNKWSSIALPPLGVGQMYNYTEIDCAKQLFLSLKTYQNNNHLQEVTIVVYYDKTFHVFAKALTSVANDILSFAKASKSVANDTLSCGLGPHPMAAPSRAKHPQASTMQETIYRRNNKTSNRKDVLQNTFPSQHAFGPMPHQHSNQARHSQPHVVTQDHGRRMKHGHSHIRHATSSRKSGYDQYGSTRQIKSRSRNSHERERATEITIYAKDSATCKRALKKMGKKMKNDFLYEERIENVPSLSKEAKSEIAKVIENHKVLVRTEKDIYLLKGKQDNVLEAHGHILKILLRNHWTSTVSIPTASSPRETVEYAKSRVKADHKVPVYWKHYKPGAILNNFIVNFKHFWKGKDFEKVDLDPKSSTYKKIVRMVKQNTDKSVIGKGKDAAGLDLGNYEKLLITNVQRVENFDLFKKYCNKRQEIFTNLAKQKKSAWPKVEDTRNASGPIVTSEYVSGEMASDLQPEINEVLLFHGTKLDTIDTICQGGFDLRLASKDAMFGQGVYGAEKPTKADQYTDDKTTRTFGRGNPKHMFLMRMILGHCFICTDPNPQNRHKYRRAPCCKCERDDCSLKEHFDFGSYDSVVGDNKKLFREFVIYEKDQCYPEYLITYERR